MGEAKVTFRVLWDEVALSELDQIWWAASDREGIEHVVTRINTELTFNPLMAGESRADNYRVLIKHPLVIWFRIMERLAEVQVVHIRVTRQK
jgi:hypothetical protein